MTPVLLLGSVAAIFPSIPEFITTQELQIGLKATVIFLGLFQKFH